MRTTRLEHSHCFSRPHPRSPRLKLNFSKFGGLIIRVYNQAVNNKQLGNSGLRNFMAPSAWMCGESLRWQFPCAASPSRVQGFPGSCEPRISLLGSCAMCCMSNADLLRKSRVERVFARYSDTLVDALCFMLVESSIFRSRRGFSSSSTSCVRQGVLAQGCSIRRLKTACGGHCCKGFALN